MTLQFHPLADIFPLIEREEFRKGLMAHAIAEHGAIYLIGDGGPLVKLGWAFDPLSRLKRLQTGHPSRLTILAFYPGTRSLETALHKEFSDLRTRGEWFDDSEGMIRETFRRAFTNWGRA
jgi:hypothetical protein